jgi:hypothetical protein
VEAEGAGFALEHRYAEDVGRQQVAGELHAPEIEPSRRASTWARVVLPVPGTSSISRWPPAIRQVSASQFEPAALAENEGGCGIDDGAGIWHGLRWVKVLRDNLLDKAVSTTQGTAVASQEPPRRRGDHRIHYTSRLLAA